MIKIPGISVYTLSCDSTLGVCSKSQMMDSVRSHDYMSRLKVSRS